MRAILYIPIFIFILVILGSFADRFISESSTPEATLTITINGIHVLWDSGKTRNLEWSEIVCVDIFDHGHVNSLRIAPKKFAFKEILYAENHLSHSCEDILKFVHDVCPYGKGISFWNENR